MRARGAGAVLHTHSIWSTLLSEVHADRGGLAIEGYEMLKGLEGVRTHEHREWLPIVANDQDIPRLVEGRARALERNPEAHGFLIRRHGMYTWGADLRQAVRHVEIFEFLMEAVDDCDRGDSKGGLAGPPDRARRAAGRNRKRPGKAHMAVVKIPAEQVTLTDQRDVTTFLAVRASSTSDGRRAATPADASADAVLAAYADKIEALKAKRRVRHGGRHRRQARYAQSRRHAREVQP